MAPKQRSYKWEATSVDPSTDFAFCLKGHPPLESPLVTLGDEGKKEPTKKELKEARDGKSEKASTKASVEAAPEPDRALPGVGLGTFEMNDEVAFDAVARALMLGYRHIDTADSYNNEGGIGRAIAMSNIPRAEVFVTTKLWPGNPAWGQETKTEEQVRSTRKSLLPLPRRSPCRRLEPLTPAALGRATSTHPQVRYAFAWASRLQVVDACKGSLKRLGLKYIDLYLIHGPFSGSTEARLAQYRGMLECKRLGLTKAVGVANYSASHLAEILDADLPPPQANQLELHPLCQRRHLREFMWTHKILPIAYSSLAPLPEWRQSGACEHAAHVPAADVACTGIAL